MGFGQLVRQAREDKDLTQERLAAKVGMHRVSIVRIETGRQECTVATLQKLCRVLSIEVADALKKKRKRRKASAA